MSSSGNPTERHVAWWESDEDAAIRPEGRSPRDGALIAMILGFFAMAWFGWGEAEASGPLIGILAVGGVAALVVAVLGAIGAFHHPRTGGAMHDPTVRRRYGIVVGIEFMLIVVGIVALGAIDAGVYRPVWICAVVGLHFFPLAAVFDDPTLRRLGAVLTAIAVSALLVGVFTEVAPGSVTGAGAGLTLLTFASLALAAPSRTRVAA